MERLLRVCLSVTLRVLPWVCPGLLGGVAHADHLRVTLTGPATPFARVEHVVERTAGAVVVRVGQHFAADFGRREAVGLLTEDDFAGLVARLDALDAFKLRSAETPSARSTWIVELEAGDRRHTFRVSDPHDRPRGEHLAVIHAIRGAVEAQTGALPYEDPFLLKEEAGVLQVFTDVQARLKVDGLWIRGRTPVRGLRLAAGPHALELWPDGGAGAHPYDIKIDAGRTTTLRVELR
ncbi:MAG: hypothetical protein R3F60_04460 [bacterium]